MIVQNLSFEGQGISGGGKDDHGIPGTALHGGSGLPEMDETAVKLQQGCAGLFVGFPGKDGALKGGGRHRIRDLYVRMKGFELRCSSVADGIDELGIAKVSKEGERVALAVFFAHKKQRHIGREKHG